MRSLAAGGETGEAASRRTFLAGIEQEMRGDVGGLVRLGLLREAAGDIIQDLDRVGIESAARPVAGVEQAGRRRDARHGTLVRGGERGGCFRSPAVRRQRPRQGQLRLGGLGRLERLHRRLGLGDGGTGLAGGEEALGSGEEVATARVREGLARDRREAGLLGASDTVGGRMIRVLQPESAPCLRGLLRWRPGRGTLGPVCKRAQGLGFHEGQAGADLAWLSFPVGRSPGLGDGSPGILRRQKSVSEERRRP
ncbi:MAG: hypothetical protein ACJ78Z_10815 [Myxococcales bacterium]